MRKMQLYQYFIVKFTNLFILFSGMLQKKMKITHWYVNKTYFLFKG